MKTYLSGALALALATISFAWAGAAMAETKTITFLFTDDDQAYVERMEALSKEFETAHPDVKVNFVSSGYDAVAKQLPVQLAVGEGPDIAKITDWQLAPYYLDMRPYMKDPDGFAKLHGDSLNTLRFPASTIRSRSTAISPRRPSTCPSSTRRCSNRPANRFRSPPPR